MGGTTDRNSLSARQANGAAMLEEVDVATVAKLLLVWFIAEVREVVGSLLVSLSPQAINGHCRADLHVVGTCLMGKVDLFVINRPHTHI